MNEPDLLLEPAAPRRGPWYRRMGLRWTGAAVGGFCLGFLYSVSVGCHST